MGDPRNPKRADEPWNLERLRVLEREVRAIAPLVTLSGGWAWHFMAPPHEELKLFHDHKDVDFFVEPSTLLSFYGDIHSTDDCVSVLAARKLLAQGLSPIGREEFVTRPG
jgi:hypothetical protein